MVDDIVPGLLETLENDLAQRLAESNTLTRINGLIEAGKATYKEANEYAIEVGQLLAETFKANLSSAVLPNGRMYYNIAERILNQTLGHNHELIADICVQVQTDLNQAAKIGIAGQRPELNQSRIDGLISRVSEAEQYNEAAWLLDEPVVNFSQSIVDDSIKTNADFHAKSGLSPKVIRRSTGKCCDWCNSIVGTYEYPNVPKDVFRRHRYCKCTVDYYPGDGRKQNVHSKEWQAPQKEEKNETRKLLGISNDENRSIRQVLRGHESTPRNAPPNSQIDKVDSNGKVVDRSFYDSNGFKEMSIHTSHHGNPKQHQFGVNGEHVEEFEWYNDGSLKQKISRDLTDEERNENADLFNQN